MNEDSITLGRFLLPFFAISYLLNYNVYQLTKMTAEATKSKAEVYLMAIQSLSKAERDIVIARLLEDPVLREDILDMAIMQQRQKEPSRPFRDYLAEKKA